MQYYDESYLLTLTAGFDRPIWVDMQTLDMNRARFGRICIEIDLNKSVVAKIWVMGDWYNVEYEGLHLLCSSRGHYGHLSRSCPSSSTSETAGSPAVHGAEKEKAVAAAVAKSDTKS
jgi:hypothetical protein